MSDTNTDTDTTDSNTVDTGLGTVATDMYSFINTILTNPSLIIILVVVIGIYVILFVYLGESSTSSSAFSSISTSTSNDNSSSTKTISIMVIAIFIILVIINGLQYFFGVDIVASLKNILTGNPEVDITVDTSRVDSVVPEIKLRPQVFNIPENDYIYADAKALCTAYGSRLATYKEIEEAYNKGGEWCNYGWSEGQMALFPTQQSTYDELQKIEGHENDCGRPGVNGGYMSNPALRFGVNCYGYKPRMTNEEEDLMATQPIYPKTEKDIAMENRVNYWKDKLTEVLVSPFNHDTWSKL
jgi:hypothetical protein